MPDIAEMDSYEMLCEDWGSAYLITRAPAAAHPYQAERRDDPAVILTAATPDALRELICVPVWRRAPARRRDPLAQPPRQPLPLPKLLLARVDTE